MLPALFSPHAAAHRSIDHILEHAPAPPPYPHGLCQFRTGTPGALGQGGHWRDGAQPQSHNIYSKRRRHVYAKQHLQVGRRRPSTLWLGGVMVASTVRGGLDSVQFRAEPSGERRSTREPPPQVQPRRSRHPFLHPHRRPARASSRPSFAKVKLRSRTRTSKSRAISNLVPPPQI